MPEGAARRTYVTPSHDARHRRACQALINNTANLDIDGPAVAPISLLAVNEAARQAAVQYGTCGVLGLDR